MDEAHEYTEKKLKALEAQITREYKQAEKEIQNKLDDYMDRYRKKDETWQKWVDEGKRTKKEYEEWRIGQLAMGQRWKEQKETIVNDLSHVNEIARNIVSKEMPDIYAENHNYGTYEVEKGSLIDTSYVLYDRDTVENLFTDQKIYHDPGRSTLNKIAQGMETRWNKQNVQSAMIQGILQGESIPNIATRLANSVGDKNRNAAIRNARTITTGVENKGRIDSYNRANKMGIKTQKQWIATLDGRTRHSHRMLDGEKAIVGKKFSNGCEYPGDPNGTAGEIYNCRCTMIADIEGYENDLKDRRDDKLGGMTYEEWKQGHNAKPIYTENKNPNALPKEDKKKLDELRAKYHNLETAMLTASPEEMTLFADLLQKERESATEYDYDILFNHQTIKSETIYGWQKEPTKEQFDAINTYTRSGYTEMNEYLRYGNYARQGAKQDIDKIHEYLSSCSTQVDLYLKRGVSVGNADKIFGNGFTKNPISKIGEQIDDKAFCSTTPYQEGGFGGNVIMYIKTPPGTHGAYIEKYAGSKDEKEFLLDYGQKFIIRDIKIDADVWEEKHYIVFLELINE